MENKKQRIILDLKDLAEEVRSDNAETIDKAIEILQSDYFYNRE